MSRSPEQLHPTTPLRRRLRAGVAASAICTCILSVFSGSPAFGQVPAPMMTLPSFAPIVAKVMPAVVNISVVEKDTGGDPDDSDQQAQGPSMLPGFPDDGTPFDQFMRRFFEQGPGGMMPNAPFEHGPTMALGSGFVIDPAGYIVTNDHVIADAKKVEAIFQDGTRRKATIVGVDKVDDLALLKVKADKPLPSLKFADSDKAKVGDWVFAVGNPFGLGGTVTKGIISARGRSLEGSRIDYFQIDASVNRGNSGGPTFDLNGDVVGINTAIYSPNGGNVGIAFDIPADVAVPVIAELKATGHAEHGWLGVQIQEISPEIAASLGLSDDQAKGALVADVVKGSPADKAGLRIGDVVVGFNETTLTEMPQLAHMVAALRPGERTVLHIIRDHHPDDITVDIGTLKADDQVVASGGTKKSEPPGRLGLGLAALTPEARDHFQIDKAVEGVVVTRIKPGSPADDAGVEVGDVIEQIDGHPVKGVREALELLRSEGKEILLLDHRHGSNMFVAVDRDHPAG
jgi:serine protease Do